nr:MAG TPA: hypothetical protein [Caudoviricetes sp.]
MKTGGWSDVSGRYHIRRTASRADKSLNALPA